MLELNEFYNEGSGWVCRRCEVESPIADDDASHLSRAFREGEAESKTPVFANKALAKWSDASRQVLICPQCGVTEAVEKS